VAEHPPGPPEDAGASFAVVLRDRRDRLDGVLMILDSKEDAEDMAVDLRRRNVDVIVMRWNPPPAAETP
jgi:hypothetical protein